jgi:hypothetical protein
VAVIVGPAVMLYCCNVSGLLNQPACVAVVRIYLWLPTELMVVVVLLPLSVPALQPPPSAVGCSPVGIDSVNVGVMVHRLEPAGPVIVNIVPAGWVLLPGLTTGEANVPFVAIPLRVTGKDPTLVVAVSIALYVESTVAVAPSVTVNVQDE